MSRWIRWGLVVVIIIAVSFPFAQRGIRFYQYQRIMESMELGEIHPETLQDGVYAGSVDAVLIQASVNVFVENGIIQDIQLEHEHGRGYRAEVVVRYVLNEQSIQVDTVSGATDSSKVILKAIERALHE